MIVYIVDDNVTLAAPFKNKTSQKLTETYLKLKKEIDKRGFTINMHALDNEAPESHRDSIEVSNSKYQLFFPIIIDAMLPKELAGQTKSIPYE